MAEQAGSLGIDKNSYRDVSDSGSFRVPVGPGSQLGNQIHNKLINEMRVCK
jgi:hypothetical protein